MHLLNTSVHFPGLPLIVVAEGELHLTWDEDATVGAGLKGIPLAYQFTSFEATGFDALEGIGAEDNLESCLFAFRLNGFKDASDNKTLSSGKRFTFPIILPNSTKICGWKA
jgi:hypothetical protein